MAPLSKTLPMKGINKEDMIMNRGIGKVAKNLDKENSLDNSKTTTGND